MPPQEGQPAASSPTLDTPLRDRVAVVAGATRGAGRGISAGLGEAGATVICTGRSSRTAHLVSDYPDRPETIEQTAELVTALGGVGLPAPVDHLDADRVAALAARIQRDHGRIDVPVNCVWGAELLKGGPQDWDLPIWRQDLAAGLPLLRLAIDTHLITSHHLLPLLIGRPGGLLVEVTAGTTSYTADHYRISAFYDLAKTAVNRLAFSQGHELAGHRATAVAITPGWLRSEMMLRRSASPRSGGARRRRHLAGRRRSRPATSAGPWPHSPLTTAGRGATSGR